MYRKSLINPGRCPRCGGKLEFRATIESREKRSDVHVFQCRCGHIDCTTHEDNERPADGRTGALVGGHRPREDQKHN